MFTGIVETIGRVVRVTESAGGRRLTVDAGASAGGLGRGASVNLNGACLTVAEIDDALIQFDVIAETLRRSNLGRLHAGDAVNLERSLRPDGRVEGHFVQGHVDGTARIVRRVDTDTEHVLWFEPRSELSLCIIPKGSIAIDGVSLTIVEVQAEGFSVALIPTTIHDTTLGTRRVGDVVNIETDVLVRTVVHWLQRMQGRMGDSGLTISKLREHGFL